MKRFDHPIPNPTLSPRPKPTPFSAQPIFQEDDFKVTSAFDDTRQEDDTDGLEDLERVSKTISARWYLFESPLNRTGSVS